MSFIICNATFDKIKRPANSVSRFVIRDRQIGGFYAVVGVKRISFRLAYSHQGKRIDANLGWTPVIDADLARKRALSLLAGYEPPQSKHLIEAKNVWHQPETEVYESLAELVTRYVASRNLSPKTIHDMQSSISRGLNAYWHQSSARVTQEVFERVYREFLVAGKETTARNLARYVRAVYRWAELPDPTEKLTKKTGHSANKVVARDRRIEAHQLDIFKRIMPTLTPNQQLTIMTALVTGMRKGELQSITANSLDHANKSIKLFKTKNGKAHQIPLPEALWLELIEASKGVLPNSPILNVGDHLPKVFTKLIPLSWHDCRRTCASMMAANGEPEALIKTILNHVDKRNVTQAHYLRFDLEKQREALSKLMNQMF